MFPAPAKHTKEIGESTQIDIHLFPKASLALSSYVDRIEAPSRNRFIRSLIVEDRHSRKIISMDHSGHCLGSFREFKQLS
jgi:hypothetical protein